MTVKPVAGREPYKKENARLCDAVKPRRTRELQIIFAETIAVPEIAAIEPAPPARED